MSSAALEVAASSFVGPDCLVGGSERTTQVDVRPFLLQPKNLKFMSKMDQLALAATQQLLERHPLTPQERAENTGLYLCVGVLPFEERELRILGERSQRDGVYDAARFVSEAMPALNPLTTFKCLPNMAAFHLSHNYGLKEAYLVTYPDRFQWAQALKAAQRDLLSGRVEYALVGAVTHQQNPLVQNYHRKLGLASDVFTPDCAGMWLLKKATGQRPYLKKLHMSYRPPERASAVHRATCDRGVFFGPVADLYAYSCQQSREFHAHYDNGHYQYQLSIGERP